jgi:hypothetical protein
MIHWCLVTISMLDPSSDSLGFLQTSQFTVTANEWRTHAAGRLDPAERKERPGSWSGIACDRCLVDIPSRRAVAHTGPDLVRLLLDTRSGVVTGGRHSAGSLELVQGAVL